MFLKEHLHVIYIQAYISHYNKSVFFSRTHSTKALISTFSVKVSVLSNSYLLALSLASWMSFHDCCNLNTKTFNHLCVYHKNVKIVVLC